MATFVDTNVVIDLLDETAENHARCLAAFEEAKSAGQVFIADIAYAELSVAMATQKDTDDALAALKLRRLPCSDVGLFRAGKAFKKYRDENKGQKLNILPDFLIGAQAEVENMALVSSDDKRLRGYFPNVQIKVP